MYIVTAMFMNCANCQIVQIFQEEFQNSIQYNGVLVIERSPTILALSDEAQSVTFSECNIFSQHNQQTTQHNCIEKHKIWI